MSRHLSDHALDLGTLLQETDDPACGALVVFSGTVRNHHEGKGVERLEYSAHPALAEKLLAQIEAECLARFEINQCRLVHRVGDLAIGEDSVFVVVRSRHRGAAFDAARWAIDELKVRVPVWKREHYDDGSVVYQEGTPMKQVDE